MGVWAGKDPGPVDVEAIAAAMRPAVEMWMTGHIQIIDLRRGQVGGPVTVFDSGANGALIQPLRTPNPNIVGGQPSTLLAIRFQVKREPAVAPGQILRGGLIVKVLDGGNAPELVPYTYSLGEAVDSSLAWDHIFEAAVVAGGI